MKNSVKKFYKQISLIVLFIIFLLIIVFNYPPVFIKEIDSIVFTDSLGNQNYSLCLPAAYTTSNGKIEGEYMINGKIYGNPSRKERISIHPIKGLIISGQWHANNGFQQTVLVKNYKARTFKDSRKRIRRALCNEGKNSNSYLIIQSSYPMTLTEFAKHVALYSYNAVNLDTGTFGFGKINNKYYHKWALLNKNSQTNWIVNLEY